MKMAQVSEHLHLIAQLRTLNGDNRFQVKAYEDAARTFRDLAWAEDAGQDIGDWHTLPGIGPSIRTTVEEFILTGTSSKLKELSDTWPVECMTMTVVQGIGPKKAYKLWESGIHNFTELAARAYAGTLDPALSESVLQAAKKQGRVPYDVAKATADAVLAKVLKVPHVLKAVVCGSIRRKVPTAKDIDIAVCLEPGAQRAPIMRAFSHLGQGFQGGEKKVSLVVEGPEKAAMRCDLWLGEPSHFGALLNHCTGSKEHNIALRTLAQSKGLTVSEYGIFRGDKKLGGEDEHDLYRVLGLKYVEPEKRTR